MAESLQKDRWIGSWRWGFARASQPNRVPQGWRAHLGVIGVELLLAAALVHWLRSGRIVLLQVPVEKGSLWWVQFPWFAPAAVLTGIIALVTFVSTRAQTQEHFERK